MSARHPSSFSIPLQNELFSLHVRPEQSVNDYWKIVISAVAQGDLLGARDLLLAHSDMRESEKAVVAKAFEEHPLVKASTNLADYASSRRQENDFFHWRHCVDELSRSRFTSANIDMADVVDILQGYDSTINHHCGDNWAKLVLSYLFYKIAPTFSLPDIVPLVYMSSKVCQGDEDLNGLVKEIMDGQLGVFLKGFYEKFFTGVKSGGNYHSLYLALQLALVNFALVLQATRALSDENEFQINEAPLVEELILAFADNFATYQYPFEVLSSPSSHRLDMMNFVTINENLFFADSWWLSCYV